MTKDPRERHVVCKLDRYELEDRYLRLQEEVNSLKKLSNGQEDKIKRLATKLMRYATSPGAHYASSAINNDRDRLLHLEAENSKLKSKMSILRNQLMNNKIFARSPPRPRRVGSSLGLITCRSEGSRVKSSTSCQCINARPGNDENDVQNYTLKIQEMENEKKEMLSRIADLETELASFASGNQREKVAENVGYIRVWRQLQRQNEKLLVVQSSNEILNEQISHLKGCLEESNKNNVQLSAALEAERAQLAQLDRNVTRVKESEVDLREKDQQISDLHNELQIMQQHNQELVVLSGQFEKIEQEHADLKRKFAYQVSVQRILKDNLSREKANAAALNVANEQLLVKISEMQKQIDTITIQGNPEKPAPVMKKQSRFFSRKSFKNLQKSSDTVYVNTVKPMQKDSSTQTDGDIFATNETTQTEVLPANSAKIIKNCSEKYREHPVENNSKYTRTGSSLSREEMIKLLDQAQINSPLESQNTARASKQLEPGPSCFVKSRKQVSKLETLLFGDSGF